MTKKRSYFWKLAIAITVLLTFIAITGCSFSAPGQTNVEIGNITKTDKSIDPENANTPPDSDKNNPSTDAEEIDSSDDTEETNSSYIPAGNMIRSSTEGAVTIDVEYLGYKDNLLSFNVAMNTHSVDLDGYDLVKLSELTDDRGNKYDAFFWDSKPGGHHRSGVLTFFRSGSQAGPDELMLIIHNIAEIRDRTFIWEDISYNP